MYLLDVMFNMKNRLDRRNTLSAMMHKNDVNGGHGSTAIRGHVKGATIIVKVYDYNEHTGQVSNPVTVKAVKFKLPRRIKL